MTTVNQHSTKMKRPQNRKLMIRDLPVGAAYLLHPSLRGILMSRQKRWNYGSPPHRIAVNLVRRYKKQLKPRVLPFFCDKCRLASRTLSLIKDHTCDKEEKKKAERREMSRKYSSYDCTFEIKQALNPEKQWRYNAMAVMEKTLKPEKVMPKKGEMEEVPTELEPVEKEPDQEFLDAQEQEFDDEAEHFPLSAVLVPSTQIRPETTLRPLGCAGHSEAGVFCFNCKGSFQTYNQYQLHLKPDFNNGKCSRALPDYYYTEKIDQTGMFNKRHRHSLVHHVPITRDVSHVRCTLCKAANFSSPGDLYAHMIKCAVAANQEEDSRIECPTVFGYGMPPSFNACQYVFPDPHRERAPRPKSSSTDPSSKAEDEEEVDEEDNEEEAVIGTVMEEKTLIEAVIVSGSEPTDEKILEISMEAIVETMVEAEA